MVRQSAALRTGPATYVTAYDACDLADRRAGHAQPRPLGQGDGPDLRRPNRPCPIGRQARRSDRLRQPGPRPVAQPARQRDRRRRRPPRMAPPPPPKSAPPASPPPRSNDAVVTADLVMLLDSRRDDGRQSTARSNPIFAPARRSASATASQSTSTSSNPAPTSTSSCSRPRAPAPRSARYIKQATA